MARCNPDRLLVLVAALLAFAPLSAEPPEEGRVVEFVQRIEESVNLDDGSFFDARFDTDALMDRVADGVDASEPFVAGFREGFYRDPRQHLGAAIAESLHDGGSYTFLRLKQDPLRAVFRLAGADGLNYHELHLAVGSDGDVVFDDIYIYLSGERFSETVRRIFVAVAAQQNRGLLERLLGQDEDYYRHLPEIQRFMIGVRNGQGEETLELYYELPENLQVRKEILIARLQAAVKVGNDEIVKATEALQRAFPGDPALDLAMIDYYFVKERWRELFDTVDRLDAVVGGDPYLDIIRANVWVYRDEPATAKRLLLGAVEADPWLEDAHAVLLDVALATDDFELTADTLTRLEQGFGYEWPDLRQVPEFARFCDSREYRTWMRRSR